MYIELQARTHFSFLRGVSSAEEMFAAAALLGYPALGIADRNSVGGLVKALRAADETGVRLIPGCRLDLMDGTGLLVWPEDRSGWSRLTRLLTAGKSRVDRDKGEKGQCFLHWEDVAAWNEGLVAALVPDEADEPTETALAQMRGHIRRPRPSRPHPSPPAGRFGPAPRARRAGEAPRRPRASPPATSSTIRPTRECSRTSSPRSATNARSTISASAASASPTAI